MARCRWLSTWKRNSFEKRRDRLKKSGERALDRLAPTRHAASSSFQRSAKGGMADPECGENKKEGGGEEHPPSTREGKVWRGEEAGPPPRRWGSLSFLVADKKREGTDPPCWIAPHRRWSTRASPVFWRRCLSQRFSVETKYFEIKKDRSELWFLKKKIKGCALYPLPCLNH